MRVTGGRTEEGEEPEGSVCVEDENKVFSVRERGNGGGVVIGNNLAVGRRARWLPHNLWLRKSKTPNQINQRTRTRVRCAQGKYRFLYTRKLRRKFLFLILT